MEFVPQIWKALSPESQEILTAILGIMIGFAAVMTALSLVVTAAVQAIIHLFKLRAKNLLYGLTRLLEIAQNQALEPSLVENYRDYAAKKITMNEMKKIVTHLKKIEASHQAIVTAEEEYAKALLAFNKSKKAERELQKFRDLKQLKEEKPRKEIQCKEKPREEISYEQWKQFEKKADTLLCSNSMVNRSKTWIWRHELETLLVESTDFDNENIDKAMQWFNRMEQWLTQRFRFRIRCITLICAFVVTLVFQVNAPELLKTLSVDPEIQIEATQRAYNHMFSKEAILASQVDLQEAANVALEQLIDIYPQHAERLEAVSGTGDQLEDLMQELSINIAGIDDEEDIVRDYEGLILNEGFNLAAASADEAVGHLALIDIIPFSKGWRYFLNVSNLFGMLMTVVLISLGAPFWFNTMRNLMSLRDALVPVKAKEEGKAQQTDEK